MGHRTISNTRELDTAQDVENSKKTRENRTVGNMISLLKNAVRKLLQKSRLLPLKLLLLKFPGLLLNKLPLVRLCVAFEVPILDLSLQLRLKFRIPGHLKLV